MSQSLLRRNGKKQYFDQVDVDASSVTPEGPTPVATVGDGTPSASEVTWNSDAESGTEAKIVGGALPTSVDSTRETEPASYPESARRAGDTGVGRRSASKEYLSPEDLQPPRLPDVDPTDDNGDEDDLLKNDVVLPWFGRTLRGIILLFAAVAIFFMVTQTASFLASVRQLSRTEQVLLAIPMVIFGLIIIWYLVKMLAMFWNLRVSPQIRIKALQELAERRDLRALSLKANRQAVEKLSSLLDDKNAYADKKYADTLSRMAVPPGKIAELERVRNRLIREAKSPRGTSRDWLNDFKRSFQTPLDEIAKKRIRKYYVHAGIMTGVSPYPLFDRLIVFRACLAMLKDLLELYALKPAWDKNLILLARVILSTYLAGVIDNAAETGVNLVMDSIPELTNATLSKGLDMIIRKGGGKGAGMLTQAYMVYRLGNAAAKMLRPIQADK